MAKRVSFKTPSRLTTISLQNERYHFPKIYLSRVRPVVGDWIVYYESGKSGGHRSSLSVAEVQGIRADLAHSDHFYADTLP